MRFFQDFLGNASSGRMLAVILSMLGVVILILPFFGHAELASHAATAGSSCFLTAWGFYGVAKTPEGFLALKGRLGKAECDAVTAVEPGGAA